MTTRQKALLASSPGIVVLLGALAWAAVDQLQLHAADRGVRLLDRTRSALRL